MEFYKNKYLWFIIICFTALFVFSAFVYKQTLSRPIWENAAYSFGVTMLAVINKLIWNLFDNLHGFTGFLLGIICTGIFLATMIGLIILVILYAKLDIFFLLH
jgi:hypothetical protein